MSPVRKDAVRNRGNKQSRGEQLVNSTKLQKQCSQIKDRFIIGVGCGMIGIIYLTYLTSLS